MAITLSNLLARVKHYRKDLHGGEHTYALQVAARKLGTNVLLKSQRVEMDTVVGQNVYEITLPAPAMEGMDETVVCIRAVYKDDGTPLRAVNSQTIRQRSLAELGDPNVWCDRMGMLGLDPNPEAIITLTVDAYVAPAITAEIVDMPSHAEEAIVAGAIMELTLIPGEGFNPTLAAHWAQRWTKEWGNYAGLVMMGSSGTDIMRIESPYQARTRTGAGWWMV